MSVSTNIKYLREKHEMIRWGAGSNPVAPTIELPGQKLVCFWLFYFADVFIIVIPELFLNLVLNNKREPI